MQGAMIWSIPFTRIAGITVRIHITFLIFMVGDVGNAASNFGGQFALQVFLYNIMLFFVVLMHELGHCFAARWVGGSADEILLWPLGGLAMTAPPNTARAHFITTACGPAVNLVFYLLTGIIILIMGFWPPINPLWSGWSAVTTTNGIHVSMQDLPWYSTWLLRFFHLNWFLFWFNVLCVGFPMDGGRLLQCILWPRYGYLQSTRIACYCGYGVAVLLGLWAFIFLGKDNISALLTTFMLVAFIYYTCFTMLQQIEMHGASMMEENQYGDFSAGYTSLERGQRKPQPGLFQRWMAERAERKRVREEEQQAADDQRVDELLAKINEQGGIQALTPEEQRFMKKASAKLKQKRKKGL
jgi:stage IV sporulation protein FB